MISTGQERHIKVRGRGRWRHWTPEAILRRCFGFARSCTPLRQRRRKAIGASGSSAALDGVRARAPTGNTMSASARSFAVANKASVTHVQRVRSSVSWFLLQQQRAYLGADQPVPPRHRVFFQLALDETDAEIWLKGAPGTHYFMMQHGILLQRYHDGTKREHEVTMPPSILESQGAECVLAAAERRRGDVL